MEVAVALWPIAIGRVQYRLQVELVPGTSKVPGTFLLLDAHGIS